MKNKYIDEILNSKIIFYAHTKEGSSNELLSAHLDLTYKYYLKLERIKKLDIVVKNIIKDTYKNVTSKTLEKAYDIFKSAIYYHDIGKANPAFQDKKMNNKIKEYDEELNSNHSNASAKIFVDATLSDIMSNSNIYGNEESVFLTYITLYFGCMISRHHTPLKDIINYIDTLLETRVSDIYSTKVNVSCYKKYFNNMAIEEFIKRYNVDKISIYILNKLLYSCIVTCDYYATYEFMNSEPVYIQDVKNSKLFETYENSKLFKGIMSYKSKSEVNSEIEKINMLRNDMFLEVEENLNNNIGENIFYLEAPTGAGKTNISINVAKIFYEKLPEITSINYIFPFNNLIEQTSKTFEDYFQKEGVNKEFAVINSVTPILSNKEIENIEKCDETNYNEEYVKNAFRMHPIKITSHINLFNTLFGTSKEANYNLYDFVNSVVIIDEIQSYSNKIWCEIITMLDKYSHLLNIKFVIMSATLPRLDYLIKDSKTKYCNLIKDSSLYKNNEIFKKRVQLDFSLIDKKLTLEELLNEITKHKGKKILVEFIKKQTARDFYNIAKERFSEIYELTGDDNKLTRIKVINEIKIKSDILIVATQTIEAGVDIDMDIGFKNISLLDSEEQFLGRINRSSKKKYECKAYFFEIDEPKKIYKDDVRLEYTIKNNDIKKILINKDFDKYYNKIMDKTYENSNKYDENNIENLSDSCGKINYRYVQKKIELINSKNIQVFLNYKITDNDSVIFGKKIWEEYKTLCSNNEIAYSKKQIYMSKLYEKINLFTYSLTCNNISDEPKYYTEKFGNIYYIENGEDFITEGKFDREKYNNYSGGIFL